MKKVYQKKTVAETGTGDCFNACIASILEIDIEKTYEVLPCKPGVWYLNWQSWCRRNGYKLSVVSGLVPPEGYSIVSVLTDRVFPEGHPSAGQRITHACVALDSVIVHDPYVGGSSIKEILYYHSLTPIVYKN